MSINKYLKLSTLLMVVTVISLTACKKDNGSSSSSLSNADDNGGYASDNARMEQNSNDVVSIADAAATMGAGGATLRTTQTTIAPCANITNDTAVTPHVLTINFGTSCTGLDGKVRSGEIIVTYTGHYKDSGSMHTITYNNYFVNGNQLSGSKTVTNNGANDSNQVCYTVVSNDTLNLGTGNGYISWQSSRVRTWVQGYSTAIRSDDVFSLTGNATLTRANGHMFTLTITTPLEMALDCAWIEAGVVSISGPVGSRTLDYGDGSCDSEAQLTINGHTYNITLH